MAHNKRSLYVQQGKNPDPAPGKSSIEVLIGACDAIVAVA